MKNDELMQLAEVCMRLGIADIVIPRTHKPEGIHYRVVKEGITTEFTTSDTFKFHEFETFQIGGLRMHYLKEEQTT